MAPNVGRGCFLCGSKDHNDCDINLDELTILGEKIGLSGDAFRAWLEEENAKEREARREEAEREARARETQLALAREVAAIEERNSLLRKRLLEAQNAARARASVDPKSISFAERGTWQHSDEPNEADRSFTSVRENTSQSDIDSRASGRQDTINGGAVALLASSTKGTILSSSDNGGERHEEKPQGVNANSPSWVPLCALKSGPAVAECHSAKSEVALPYSELVQLGAVTSHVGTAENHTGNVPRSLGTSGHGEYSDVSRREQEMTFSGSSLMQCDAARNDISMVADHTIYFPQVPLSSADSDYCSVSCREQEATNEGIDKESAKDSSESTRPICPNSGVGCYSTRVLQETVSTRRTSGSSFALSRPGILSPEKDVLPTCLARQGIWASREFAHPFLCESAYLEHLIIHCNDVHLRALLSASASTLFERTRLLNIFAWCCERASLFRLCNKLVRSVVRFVWDAIT